VYSPEKEPPGYFQDLQARNPEVIWDDKGTRPPLQTPADWVAAGELVFDAGIVFTSNSLLTPNAAPELFVHDPKWYEKTGTRADSKGIVPYFRYVVREKGKVEIGALSCAMCHTRIMPDGSTIKGAQGNFPFQQAFAYELRHAAAIEPANRGLMHGLYAVPWLKPDPQGVFDAMSLEQVAAHFDPVPPGVMARHATGLWSPVQIPDLIGVESRQYLDRTGLQRHRGPADIMRYAALNQGLDEATTFGGALVSGRPEREAPEGFFLRRYTDEQLYALALYLYSLKPPKNPNLPGTPEQQNLVERGREIFMDTDNRCVTCHDPKTQYTNNKLVVAPGFVVPQSHPERDRIMRSKVNTDPTLTLKTRRGTGLYKVPSLLGVWYRGPFEHNGSCATLEDWFDPARIEDQYAPTGWRGPLGTAARAVKGHEYGLDLPAKDRKALIAFLKTL
jgi:hypothetical protein